MPAIKKVLIANRGEIALRIIRTCKERGLKTVAVYSEADIQAPHVIAADESVYIGKAPSSESYLRMDALIKAAKQTSTDAIHPGYGFLSENAQFAEICHKNDLIFIGPNPRSIEMMGDKTRARELMAKANVPFPPGTESDLTDLDEAKAIAKKIGYPVLIKAAAGGGGKGMRIVHTEEDFEKSVKAAKSEAKNAFGDDRVFVEKYLEEPRHIEFQIFADSHGNIVHMFERECSIQRRHQKVIEEAPSAILNENLRKKMADAAIAAARSCDYLGAGTVEFLVDKHLNFYFLEMNTRLQVEHPVTEYITGLDLVGLQIDVAEGKKLPFTQDEIIRRGHSIECRIYAEDPADQFLPSTGKLEKHRIPSGPGVRVDAGIEEGQNVSINYDPMISKLCVHAADRDKAIEKMVRALDEYEISGVRTTIPFCKFVMNNHEFKLGKYDTHFISDHYTPDLLNGFKEPEVAAILSAILKKSFSKPIPKNNQKTHSASNTTNWWTSRKQRL